MRIIMEQTVDEKANPTPLKPRVLIIPEDLMIVAQEILRSTQKPFSNENTKNVLMGEFGHAVSHYLSSSTAWFLLAKEHDMNVFIRNQMRFTNGDDFETGDALFKVYMRLGTGFGDWRGVTGTNGSP